MIHIFRARNYGCLVNVTASLTPLHAFIGPNDSGKSTLLHGMRTVVQIASRRFAFEGGMQPFDPFLPIRFPVTDGKRAKHDITLGCAVEGGWYVYEVGPGGPEERVGLGVTGDASGGAAFHAGTRIVTEPSGILGIQDDSIKRVVRQLAAARIVRLDPDALRRPSGLVPETAPIDFLDDRGYGLPGVYFAIKNRDDGAFAAVTEDVRLHFPTIQSLRVKAVSSSEVVLEAMLVSGERVEARRMSEGLLYYLAFAALRFLDPVSLLLVEEPENGLHPARIVETVKILRAIAESGTQVVMATHSPLIINELRPEEVSVITRTLEQGTKITPIKDTPSFELRTKAYALGELWLSYANGVDEAPLLKGGRRP